MRSFIRGPNDYMNDDEEDEFVDPDLVDPIFFPVDIDIIDAHEAEAEDVEEEEDAEGTADEDEDEGEDDDEDDEDFVADDEDFEVDDEAEILEPNHPIELNRNRDNGVGVQLTDNNHNRRINPLPLPPPTSQGSTASGAGATDTLISPVDAIVVNVTTCGDHDADADRPGLDSMSSSSSKSDDIQVVIDPEHRSEIVPCEAQLPMKRSHDDDTTHSENDPVVITREPKRVMKEDEHDSSSRGQTEQEIYSNPFVSAEEGIVDEEALRGDRIGQTIYSERHILKILMKWIEELPKYSGAGEGAADDADTDEEIEECEAKKLERNFKKEMSLLWDMSSEPDVSTYLASNGIFEIIRNSLVASRCERLTEISLGILANVLSSTEMAKELSKEDSHLKLVQTVVSVGCGSSSVPILLQVLAVLRRITWYMRHDSVVDTWISETVISPQFQTMLTLILQGSTNSVLIKDSVMVVFSLLETLITQDGDGEESGDGGIGIMDSRVEALGTVPLVTALCEGLEELLKVPEGEAAMVELIDDVQRIHPQLQLGLRSGLGALCYIQKIPTGKMTLRAEKETVIGFVIHFFCEFSKMTDDLDKGKKIEYLVAGLALLTFCHIEFNIIQPNAVIHPFAAAEKLMNEDYDENVVEVGCDGKQDDLSLVFVLHEHLTQLRLKFGAEEVLAVFEEEKKTGNSNLIKFLESIDESVRVHTHKEKVEATNA